MNKHQFIAYMAKQNLCTQVDAEKNLNMVTKSIIKSLGEGEEITLIGFGKFSVAKKESRDGHNPATGAPIKIPAYKQPKFKAGQTLKDAVNKKK